MYYWVETIKRQARAMYLASYN